MKVGILGSGEVGRALGKGFASRGHDVKIGSRNPKGKDLQAWLKETKGKASTGSPAEAAAHGELIVLAVLGAAVDDAINLAGREHFDGKVIIDTTNPLDFSKGMPPGLFVGTTDSLGERIQRRLPKARVVKALNTVSHTTMIDPSMKDGTPDMLVAGNDAGAKKAVAALLKELGWSEPIDTGDIG